MRPLLKLGSPVASPKHFAHPPSALANQCYSAEASFSRHDQAKDLAATRSALRALEEGRVVPMFPEGKILPQSGEAIGEGKHGVAFLALRAKVPVIPAYIRGTPRSNEFRRSFFTPSHARVVYGPPIDPAEFSNHDTATDERAFLTTTTDRFMAAIAALRDHELSTPHP